MNVADLIARKRDGRRLASGEIAALIDEYARGEVPEYQMAAWAMAVLFRDLSFDETVELTRAMRDSGQVLQWPDPHRVGDKHSTGGVGDKVSIPLAPALAACGLQVPMISGRGLGATGGTLDKLESIEGFSCELDLGQLRRVVDGVGCCITGATRELAPADRRLYALRDVTGTVPSIPLITGSILSKKLAAGLGSLVLDVKWGSGAFMKARHEAHELASRLVAVANALGMRTAALITDMNQPVGRAVGNTTEIEESLDVLRGGGPADVRRLVEVLGGELLAECGVAESPVRGAQAVARALDSGGAMERFERMVAAQGGELSRRLPTAPRRTPVFAEREGWLVSVDAEQIGRALIELGGGRRALGDPIDRGVGLQVQVRIGEPVDRKTPLATIEHRGELIPEILERTRRAFAVGDERVEGPPLIVERVSQGAEERA